VARSRVALADRRVLNGPATHNRRARWRENATSKVEVKALAQTTAADGMHFAEIDNRAASLLRCSLLIATGPDFHRATSAIWSRLSRAASRFVVIPSGRAIALGRRNRPRHTSARRMHARRKSGVHGANSVAAHGHCRCWDAVRGPLLCLRWRGRRPSDSSNCRAAGAWWRSTFCRWPACLRSDTISH
jgi:hypothetical protein